MTVLERTGPLHDAHAAGARWTTVDGMAVPSSIDGSDAARLAQVGIGDLCFRRRFGVKGRAAKAWLEAAGLAVPEAPNTWARSVDAPIVARLGLAEFVVCDTSAATVRRLTDAPPAHGVCPVARFDADLLIAGPRANDLFRETCAFDVASLDPRLQPLAITSMAGVAVTLLAFAGPHGPHWRLWCDGSYGVYLWRTLCDIAGPLGGGAVGLDVLGALGW